MWVQAERGMVGGVFLCELGGWGGHSTDVSVGFKVLVTALQLFGTGCRIIKGAICVRSFVRSAIVPFEFRERFVSECENSQLWCNFFVSKYLIFVKPR